MGQAHPLRGEFSGEDFLFEPPRPADIPKLAQLAKHSGLDDSAWRSVLAARNAICAKTPEGKIVGLCIANHYSLIYHGEEFRNLRAGLNILCNRFKLADTAIAFGAQTFISAAHGSAELRGHLLQELLRAVGLRYHHLFRSCRKDDSLELHLLQEEGWRCFQEEDDTCHLMLDVAKTLRGLASRFVLGSSLAAVRAKAAAAATLAQPAD
jgi:hypothetical protein